MMEARPAAPLIMAEAEDRKSTRLNSSHSSISYAVFCLKKKTCISGPRYHLFNNARRACSFPPFRATGMSPVRRRTAARAAGRFPATRRGDPASLRRRCQDRPVFHLHSRDEPVATVLGAEDRGFALFDLEPILAERIDDVRLVRNENRVGARSRGVAQQVPKSLGAAVILVRRNHKPALRDICGLLDMVEPGNHRGLVRSVVLAGIDLADWNAGLTDGVAESLCQRLSLIVEIPLGRDVVEVERIGVRLIREGRPVTDHDDKSPGAQRLDDIAVVRGGATGYREAERAAQARK